MILLLEDERDRPVGTQEFGPYSLAPGQSHVGLFLRAAAWPPRDGDLFVATIALSEDGERWEEHSVTTDGENQETPGAWHMVLDMGCVGAEHAQCFTHERHRLVVRIRFVRPLRCGVKIATERQAR